MEEDFQSIYQEALQPTGAPGKSLSFQAFQGPNSWTIYTTVTEQYVHDREKGEAEKSLNRNHRRDWFCLAGYISQSHHFRQFLMSQAMKKKN